MSIFSKGQEPPGKADSWPEAGDSGGGSGPAGNRPQAAQRLLCPRLGRGRANCWTLGPLRLGGVGRGVGVPPGQTSWLAPSKWPGDPCAGMGAPHARHRGPGNHPAACRRQRLTGQWGPGCRGGCGSRQGRRPPSKGLSQARTNLPHGVWEQKLLHVTPWEDEHQSDCSVTHSFSKQRPRARRWAKADKGQDKGLGGGAWAQKRRVPWLAARLPGLGQDTVSRMEARGSSPSPGSVSGRIGPGASECPQGSQCGPSSCGGCGCARPALR